MNQYSRSQRSAPNSMPARRPPARNRPSYQMAAQGWPASTRTPSRMNMPQEAQAPRYSPDPMQAGFPGAHHAGSQAMRPAGQPMQSARPMQIAQPMATMQAARPTQPMQQPVMAMNRMQAMPPTQAAHPMQLAQSARMMPPTPMMGPAQPMPPMMGMNATQMMQPAQAMRPAQSAQPMMGMPPMQAMRPGQPAQSMMNMNPMQAAQLTRPVLATPSSTMPAHQAGLYTSRAEPSLTVTFPAQGGSYQGVPLTATGTAPAQALLTVCINHFCQCVNADEAGQWSLPVNPDALFTGSNVFTASLLGGGCAPNTQLICFTFQPAAAAASVIPVPIANTSPAKPQPAPTVAQPPRILMPASGGVYPEGPMAMNGTGERNAILNVTMPSISMNRRIRVNSGGM